MLGVLLGEPGFEDAGDAVDFGDVARDGAGEGFGVEFLEPGCLAVVSGCIVSVSVVYDALR